MLCDFSSVGIVARRNQVGKLRALLPADSIESDVRSTRSYFTGDRIEVSGLKAWIGGEPVNLVATGPSALSVQPVRQSSVSPARRPHFDRPPRLARGHGPGNFLLVGRERGGSWMAVRISITFEYVHPRGANRSDVGLLLRPPGLPLFFGLALAIVGLVLGARTREMRADGGRGRGKGKGKRRRRRRDRPNRRAWGRIARLGAVALFVEATMLLYGAYRLYC